MAAAVGQQVVILLVIPCPVRGFAAQHLADRVYVGGGTVGIGAVGGAQRVGEELALGTSVWRGGDDIGIGDPVIPTEHARAELAAGGDGAVLPGFAGPQFHHPAAHLIGGIIIATILGGLVDRQGLEHLVPDPVIAQRLD